MAVLKSTSDKVAELKRLLGREKILPRTCQTCGGSGFLPFGFYDLGFTGGNELEDEPCPRCSGVYVDFP